MKEIVFEYKPFPGPEDVPRPVAEITLVNGNKRIRQTCIIDTGADTCTIPLSFIHLLGIDIRDVRRRSNEHPFGCACGRKPSPRGYYYPISIKMPCHKKLIKANVLWVDANVPPLLGREGIIDTFDVVFKRGRKKVLFIPK